MVHPYARRHLTLRVLAVTLVTLLVTTGCSLLEPESTPESSVRVEKGRPAKATSAEGELLVLLPAGAVDGPGTLTVAETTGPDGQDGWAINLDGAELTGQATLRFKLPDTQPGEPPPLISYNEKAGDPLKPVASKLEGDQIVVVTDHFSNWFLDRWTEIRDRVMPVILDRFDRLLSTAGEGKRPRCDNEQAVRDSGYQVTSDSGRRVYWCLGREHGTVVLKAVNARGYGVAAESTPGLNVADVEGHDLLGWLAEQIKAPPYSRDNHVELIPSGNQITYAIDDHSAPGGQVEVSLRADPAAYLLSAAAFAVDTMATLLARFGTDKAAAHLASAMKSASCANAFSAMATTPLTSPADAQAFFADALTMSFDCVEAVVKDSDFGVILQGIVQPIVWIWTGVLTIVNGVVAAVDTGSELFGVAGYTITVTGIHKQTPDAASRGAAADWWKLNGICRGFSKPVAKVERACEMRDAETRRQAYAAANAFIIAWRRQDRDGLSNLVTDSWVVDQVLSYTLANEPDPLCRYYEHEPQLSCWVYVQETDVGAAFTVVLDGPLVPDEPLPWKVRGVAPDVG